MRSTFGFLIALFFACTVSFVDGKKVTNPKRVPKNAILLSNVESLLLRAGKQTSSRRVSPIPQLQCVGPASVCRLYSIDAMRCKNEGADYDAENIVWSCRADLPDEFKLGSTDVTCEGYESSDDPYVLKGSCGVEYRLALTEKGEEKYGNKNSGWGEWEIKASKESSTLAEIVFFIIFGTVLFLIIRGFLQACRRSDSQRRPGDGSRWNGGGGGGGGGGDNDPPPPYDSHDFGRVPPRRTKAQSSSSSSTRSSTAGQQAQEGWRPGFWTGALGGAAAGYFASQRNKNQRRREEAMRGYNNGGGWGLFGGPNGSRRSGGGWGGGSSSSSSPGPSYSSSRHESTGFGGTSRR